MKRLQKKGYIIRMQPSLHKILEVIAEENGETLSSFVCRVMKWAAAKWKNPQPEATNPVKRIRYDQTENEWDPEIAETIRIAKEKWENE